MRTTTFGMFVVAIMVSMVACEGTPPSPALLAPSMVINPAFQPPLTVQPASGPVGLQPKVQWETSARFVELKRGEKVIAQQTSGLLVDEPLSVGEYLYVLRVSGDGTQWTELARANVSVR